MIELAGEVIKLQETVERFMQITDVSLSPRLSSILAILTRNLKIVRDFFELNNHDEALKWMAWHYRHDITSPLVVLRGYLELLQLGMLKETISWTPEQERCLNRALEHATALHTILSDSLLSDLNPYRSQQDHTSLIVIAMPEDAFAPLWSITNYLLRDISPRFVITIQPDLPLVCYDRVYTTSLLIHFFEILSRVPDLSGIIYVDSRAEAEFCALSIRVQHLRMTPQLWQQTQQSFYYGDEIERLQELGGSIEPLTWDEGHGQGVIIRLPWAK
jgi:hypothetical protein